jgi:hypothetical protein
MNMWVRTSGVSCTRVTVTWALGGGSEVAQEAHIGEMPYRGSFWAPATPAISGSRERDVQPEGSLPGD